MNRIYPPEIKRYAKAGEFKKVFQKFFNSICIQQNDPLFGSPVKSRGVCLSINSNKSKEKELNVSHSSKLCPKCFDFSIECFSKSISRSVDKEV